MNRDLNMKYRSHFGFTLIELMITVAIVAIIASVAMYSYGGYIRKANRTDARATLSETATSLEKCRSIYSAYNHASCNVAFPVTSSEGYYSIASAFNANGTTFTLTATPVVGQPQTQDAECATLTLTNTGVQGATGSDTSVCW